jgi:SurA N-terminal domain
MLPPMRRPLLVIALGAALLVAGLLATRDGSPTVVARVGSAEITEAEVERTVDRINAELEAEGREVAPEGSEGERQLRESALNLLAYHARLEQGAAELGITVTSDEVRGRLGGGNTGEGAEGGASALEALRAQLLYERIFTRVTHAIVVTPIDVAAHRRPGVDDKTLLRELLSERRQAAMKAWLARTEKRFPVRAA